MSEWKSPDKVEVALQRAFEALDKTIVWDRESSKAKGSGCRRSLTPHHLTVSRSAVERLQTVATQFVPTFHSHL